VERSTVGSRHDIYIYIDFSTVAPIPWRYRSQNDLQRIFKIICFLADPGNAICKSEAVND